MNLIKNYKKIRAAIVQFFNLARICGVFYYSYRKKKPIRKNLVLFESHHGKDLMGNPYYMLQHILKEPEFANLLPVVAGRKKAKTTLQYLDKNRRVKICRPNSLRYSYYLATAEYLVSDVTFPPYFSRRTGQKYLNTWHGTPLKTLGRKIADSPFIGVSNVQRNFLHATHILAPNRHTEDVLLKDYMIDKIWRGRIIRCGYPRNDIFIQKNLYKNNQTNQNLQKNIAFMPTWRGKVSNLKESGQTHAEEIQQLLDHLSNRLPGDINFWVKLHPLTSDGVNFDNYESIKVFPTSEEPYKFLSKCDILITDYSSVMFDFANSRKPILLYIPDEDDYKSGRQFCLDFHSEVPFPKIKSPEQLVDNIIGTFDREFIPPLSYQRLLSRFCYCDNGHSSSDLCSHFFSNKKILNERELKPDRSKKSVLLFVGSFINNGITSSIKNLLEQIDLDKFNLYLWIDHRHGNDRGIDYFNQLDHRIKYIATQNWLAVDIPEGIRFLFTDLVMKNFSISDKLFKKIWRREYKRRFADVEWDTIIHFTGYERMVTFLMFGASNAKKIVYMHNDMYEEIKSSRIHDPRSIKLSYEIADVIAAVRVDAHTDYSKKIMDINKKIHFVPNTISKKYKILAQEDLGTAIKQYQDEEIHAENQLVLKSALAEPNQFRFINLGRFSKQKGQSRLIEAFEKVWKKQPNCQLFIIGGYGILYDDIKKQSLKSPARDSIFIFLGSSNPLPLLSRMDVFVFSSFYEGIGLVLYESFSLGIPVVSTDIPGPSELLNQGYGLVVENSIEGLAKGMEAALRNEIPQKRYNIDAHNKNALEQFYNILE